MSSSKACAAVAAKSEPPTSGVVEHTAMSVEEAREHARDILPRPWRAAWRYPDVREGDREDRRH